MKKYDLSWGAYIYWGTDDWYDGEGFQVYLCSEGLDFNGSWTGSGDRLLIEFISDAADEITSGTYEFEDVEPLPVFSFDSWSFWEIGLNTAENDGCYWASGTVELRGLGDDEYEFTVDAGDECGNDVTAHFKGTLDYYDATLKKSTMPKVCSTGHKLRAVRVE